MNTINNLCANCDHYESDIGNLCSYCYKIENINLISKDHVGEVCRKCDKPYQYLEEDLGENLVGEDICYECVRFSQRYDSSTLSAGKMAELFLLAKNDPVSLHMLTLLAEYN